MQPIIQFFVRHPYLASIVATWIFNNVITVLVSSMPAPTKDSTGKYVYWFKVLNTFIGNVRRAQSTAVENSPNWQDAVQAHLEKNGLALPAPPTPPTPKGSTP
jgi:hypothetical protein